MAFEQQRAAIAAATDRLAEAAEGAARAAAQALLAGVGAEMLKATPDEYGEPFINVTFLGGGPPRDCQGAVWDGAGNERFAGADDACRMLEEAVLTLGFCGRVSYGPAVGRRAAALSERRRGHPGAVLRSGVRAQLRAGCGGGLRC